MSGIIYTMKEMCAKITQKVLCYIHYIIRMLEKEFASVSKMVWAQFDGKECA